MKKFPGTYWPVFVIPGIIAVFAILLKMAAGPFWQYPDPTYVHLFNSVNLVKGLPSVYYDSPGVPVQILGQIIISFLNIGHSTALTINSVLVNPEFYLSVINSVLDALVLITAVWMGLYVFRKTNDSVAVFLSQLPDFLIMPLRSHINDHHLIYCNISPEHLLIAISNLFNLFLLKLFFSQTKKEENLYVMVLGILGGLGVATKLTFTPLLLLPLVFSRGMIKPVFIILAVLSFVLGTWPIIPLYPKMWAWITDLSTHTGIYGQGGKGIIDVQEYLDTWKFIFHTFWFFVLFPLGALIFSLIQIILKRANRDLFFIAVTSFVILAQYLGVAKHFDEHYLVLAINSLGPLCVLSYIYQIPKGYIAKIVILVMIAFGIIQSALIMSKYIVRLGDLTKETVGFSSMIHAKYPHSLYLGSYLMMPIGTPEYALFMGNDSSGGAEEQELSALYPDNYILFTESRDIAGSCTYGLYHFTKPVFADDLLKQYPDTKIIFINSGYGFEQTPYIVKPLENNKFSHAYLLVGSTEKAANAFFNAAVNMLQKGDYKEAFALGLKSYQLNYQPKGKIEFLLGVLYSHLKH